MPESKAESGLRELSFLSLLAGASSLIPVPVLDDWAFRFVRRQMIERSLPAGYSLSKTHVRHLTGGSRKFARGCFYSAFWAPILLTGYVVKRIFKKVFFFLALKEATDRASEIFHEGYLLRYAFQETDTGPQLLRNPTGGQIEQLHWAVTETVRELDTSPVRKSMRMVFRASRGVLFEASSQLARLARRDKRIRVPEAEEEETLESERRLLSRTLDSLTRALHAHHDYLEHVRDRFRYYAARRGIHLEQKPVVRPDKTAKPPRP